MKINSLLSVNKTKFNSVKYNKQYQQPDFVSVENANVDKKVLIERGIIPQDKNINEFFSEISSEIFENSNTAHSFENLLKFGYVSLSSSAYADLKNPKSAVGIKASGKKSFIQNCACLEENIKNGIGMGINFNDFNNPASAIKGLNDYFKYRQATTKRPPAAMGLLSVYHPKILEFISLKDNADYQNWCFDLSVIIDDDFLNKADKNENITLFDGSKLSAKDVYTKLLCSMKKSGEPGVVFSNNKDYICDCCAAAELKDGEGLVLSQINLSKFYNPKTNDVDYSFLSLASNILAQASKKIDTNSYISVLGYQDLLNKMKLSYGEKKATDTLDKIMNIIEREAKSQDIKLAISPSGTISRFLKTTPSLEPDKNQKPTYYQELDTMIAAQKHLDGGISKTINLKFNHDISDIDLIIRYAKNNGIKGISVFPDNAD